MPVAGSSGLSSAKRSNADDSMAVSKPVGQDSKANAYDLDNPPEIEHITQNYVLLKHVLLGVTEMCGKELLNLLRTTENLPTNNARKEQFLNFLVAARQLFVKAYVLCKWSVVSKDISTAIDVANWLRGQTNCLNNVVQALFHLQEGLGPVKAITADLNTALNVFKYGEPEETPESELFTPKDPLKNIEVLKVLRRLDILISMRLALYEKLPGYYRNYTVQNGRAKFAIEHSNFWLELSIADDDVAQQCRFFYVDFGIQGFKVDKKDTMFSAVKVKMEQSVNEKLTASSLESVLDWLAMLACTYSIRLIADELQKLQLEAGPWAGVFSHRYDTESNSISLKYFTTSPHPAETIISISSSAPYTLTVQPQLQESVTLRGPEQLRKLLAHITRQRAAEILAELSAPWITSINAFSVSVQLSLTRFVKLSIDTTSGRFILSGSIPRLDEVQSRLNAGEPALDVLNELRALSYIELLALKAESVGWKALRNVKLAPTELSKLSESTRLLALTLPFSSGWYYCVAVAFNIKEMKSDLKWFAAKLQSIQRRWYIEDMVEQNIDNENDGVIDYASLLQLKTKYSKDFVLLELARDLRLARLDYSCSNFKLQFPESSANEASKAQKEQSGEKSSETSLIINFESIVPKSTIWAYSGLTATVSATSKEITLNGKAKQSSLHAFGAISHKEDNFEIEIYGSENSFKIVSKSHAQQLSNLLQGLKFLDHAIGSLVAISQTRLGLKIRHATLSSLEITYAEPNGIVVFSEATSVQMLDNNPQKFLTPFLPDASKINKGDTNGFAQVIAFLKDWYPLCEFLTKNAYVVLPQTLNCLRIQAGFKNDDGYLEISYRQLRNKGMVNFITAGNGADRIPQVKDMFTKRMEGVVPLNTGCAVDCKHPDVLIKLVKMLNISAS
ncbi:Rgr1 protein [Starmerella bacillaris]|uniref:Mediator of RNA polymerase II transcription subunit 14 n=1 Tax=Starmerella bacillaris TaxID=1247836 RepID=A0AAV5RLP1_STABA|nr:Rgr1 protein [Starmerella bacillaris]